MFISEETTDSKLPQVEFITVEAMLADALDKKDALTMVFINKHDEIDSVSVEFDGDAIEGSHTRLLEEAAAKWGRPYFDIVTVNGATGQITTSFAETLAYHRDGRGVVACGIASLLDVIKEARDKRTSFYENRQQEFGPSAWPEVSASS
jgi:hypothetical protein